jgi:hypothetical protein
MAARMKKNSEGLEQHIAVFGESGSGKTVMISSFYGAAKEKSFESSSRFSIITKSTTQGKELQQNYLQMKTSAQVPAQTRFKYTPYEFRVEPKVGASAAILRLVWHDYPGEWFEDDVQSPEESSRQVQAFQSLLSSDVALVLVDAQKLLDNRGEEERYLKSLFGNLQSGLLRLRPNVLNDGNRLDRFPRIWILALSKADLMPEVDVYAFRDLLIEKATVELNELERVLRTFVTSPEGMSVGEDFVLLSSAKFEPNQIDVDQRIGLELILPLAGALPLERYGKLVKRKQLPMKIADELLGGAGVFMTALIGKRKFKDNPKAWFAATGAGTLITTGLSYGREALRKAQANAVEESTFIQDSLDEFKGDLEKAKDRQTLYLS